ncbi:hypothetical protein [Pseudonocardia sp. GCM10023141]|uniref:hypothetical protein n=1 Tax=Pseudonocardia sp. GCM10023141 TaxID=3252653 RepID=UPI00361454A2
MLKKAGIVVAAAAAGLLAVSPLAFAGDKGGDWHHGHSSSVTNNNSNGDTSGGLVNVADNNVNVPIQACNNNIPVNVLGVQVSDVTAELTGALGLLGTGTVGDTTQSADRTCGDNSGSAGDAHVQD